MEEAKNDNREMTPSDEPIKNEHDDILGWKPYAQLVAKALFNPSSNDSMVYAIDGPWGSGKSSLLNLIGEQLAKLNKDKKENEKYTVIVNYRPWNVALDQNAIIKEFFDVFVRTSKLGNRSFKIAAAKALLIVDASLDAAVSLCQIFHRPEGALLKSLRGLVKPFVGFAKAALNDDKELSKAKDKLEKKLRKQKALRFLVIIDDLDRLNRDEIKLVVQLIKAVGNLPNVSYLLAIDWNTVAKALDGEQTGESGTGESYLSKIVQNRLPVPEIDNEKIINLIQISIDPVFKRYRQRCDWTRSDVNHFLKLIPNLRMAKKYVRTLTFFANAFCGNIDPTDLAAFVAIKLFDPSLYHLVNEYQQELLGFSSSPDREREYKEKLMATSLGGLDPISQSFIQDDLFPNAFQHIQWSDSLITNLHLWNPNVFGRLQKMESSSPHLLYSGLESVLKLDNIEFAKWIYRNEELAVNVFEAKANILFEENRLNDIGNLIALLFESGTNFELGLKCLRAISPHIKLSESELADALNAKDAVVSLEVCYEFLIANRDSDDEKEGRDRMASLTDRLMESNSTDLFRLSPRCFKYVLHNFSKAREYCESINDPESLKKMIVLLGKKSGYSREGKKRSRAFFGIMNLVLTRAESVKPFLKEWINEAPNPNDLAAFIMLDMYLSGEKFDDTLEEPFYYDAKDIERYTSDHYPSKLELIQGLK